MRNLTHHLYEYFYYTRAERNASIVLSFLCLFFFILPNFYVYIFPPPPPTDFSEFRAIILAATSEQAVTENVHVNEYSAFRGEKNKAASVELFQFDPNTATKDELVRLGLSARTAQTLINFRSKGGKFFQKKDLKKVYGLRQEDYDRLSSFVMIEKKDASITHEKQEIKREADHQYESADNIKTEESFYPKKEIEQVQIDINKASIEEWQKIKGIGPGYSKRIVNFREKLGGFSSIEQVGETYGLPDSVFQKISSSLIASPISKKLLINQCDLDELKTHPYINSYQATILFNYRKQHGSFEKMEDLKKIKAGFKEEDWVRIEPYISF